MLCYVFETHLLFFQIQLILTFCAKIKGFMVYFLSCGAATVEQAASEAIGYTQSEQYSVCTNEEDGAMLPWSLPLYVKVIL